MGGKFEVVAGKHKTCRLVLRDYARLPARLEVPVGRLAIRNTVRATVKVASCSAAAVPSATRRSPEHRSHCRKFDRSWRGAFDRWQNLTGHIAYRIFDRLPVKYRVPSVNAWCLFQVFNKSVGYKLLVLGPIFISMRLAVIKSGVFARYASARCWVKHSKI